MKNERARSGLLSAGAFALLLCVVMVPRLADGAEQPAPRIKVTAAQPEAEPSAPLRAAYRALQARDFEAAGRLYQDLARTDPRNVDVLLGQAAVAAQRNDYEAARTLYLAVLKLEPRNAAAQGGLLALFGRADYPTAELRLKGLLAREPNAFLYHALGTLYAEQAFWPQAQHAYFQAYHLDPASADHAFNLAVSLEHVGQRSLARTYYRRAMELARTSRAATFDLALAEERAARLATADNN